MQKILSFELATAMRGRSKVFQAVTLLLLSFSIAVVVFSFTRVLEVKKPGEASQQKNEVGFIETASGSLLRFKK